ncbi:MAG: universal stress protein [Nocardioidaceae bacterium]
MHTGPIVVGFDGSADSERALDWAITAAKQRKSPLHLISVLDFKTPGWLPERVEEARRRAEEQLSADGDIPARVPVSVTTPEEDPATFALLQRVSDAQLVVLGARGHGALSGLLIGSMSQHLSRHAECPVVVVREQHDVKANRIVLGFDDSPGSQRAAEFAFETASLSAAPLTVIHGWRYSSAGSAGLFVPIAPDIAEEIDSQRAAMRKALSEWPHKYPDVEFTLEAIPLHPTRTLADASEHAALVVVGSRGRGAFKGMLLGSVSQGLLHHAACTVAIVR